MCSLEKEACKPETVLQQSPLIPKRMCSKTPADVLNPALWPDYPFTSSALQPLWILLLCFEAIIKQSKSYWDTSTLKPESHSDNRDGYLTRSSVYRMGTLQEGTVDVPRETETDCRISPCSSSGAHFKTYESFTFQNFPFCVFRLQLASGN